jgi:hypothetical protein
MGGREKGAGIKVPTALDKVYKLNIYYINFSILKGSHGA